jgi:8-oxo-dGTP pyrophosphatase MutT (NUDIX family)
VTIDGHTYPLSVDDRQEYVVINAIPCVSPKNSGLRLLVHKNRPAWQAGYLNLIGGKVEQSDESIEAAAIRELREETGLTPVWIVPPFCVGMLVCPDAIIYCYNVWVNEYAPLTPQEGETEKVAWFNWQDVLHDSRLMPNLRVVLPLMQNGVSGWMLNVTTNSLGQEYHEVNLSLPSSSHPNHSEATAVTDVIAGKDLIERVKHEKPVSRTWFGNLRLRLWLWWRELREDAKAS